MEIVKQNKSLNVVNHDYCLLKSSFVKHNALIGGDSKRGLILGSSGSGKTNAMVSLILEPNGLRFQNVYIYSKTLDQPKYVFLKQALSQTPGIGYYEYDDGADIIPPESVKPYSVMVFDDVVCCNQSIIRDYYSFGRHYNIDCFYLCQTYSSIPKRLIRDNANCIVLFQQDNKNLKHVYDGHVNLDIPFEKLQDMCSMCWQKKHGFLVIDKDSPLDNGRFRMGFDGFFKI